MMLVVLAAMAVHADGFPARRLFNETPEQKTERLSWWTHDRFGMFIHFGLYSLPARGEMTWKSSEEVVALLGHTVSKGGNLIMNVGPTARGKFDARATSRLNDIGEWMKLNSRSIYGCTEAPERFAAPDNTILTYNPASNRLYVHLLAYPGTRLACRFADEIAYAQFLHDASEICVEHHGERIEQKQDFYESGCERISYLLLPAVRPDVLVPVIEVILKDR